ncbi:hypothetical protein JCM21900_000775 [Sporobolomyces salmonicolor]
MAIDSSASAAAPLSIPDKVGDFKLVTRQKLDFAADVQIAKWESESTGLKVVWSGVEGPLVQGYFSVVTEIFDASGRPHTLEHLIFLGSEKYPYKGILDTLANRSFATGTNAWTANDNTTYTVGTAGQEGFLKILPVYVDHVLYPTITDSGFVTEVFNINGKGEEGGVVFGEMQGREQGSSDLMHLRQQETLYSMKNALRSETGGLLKALRVLKVEEIREYHGAMYVPQNITINVAGRSLDPTKLLETLTEKVIPSIVEHKQNRGSRPPGWIRPFVESSTASNPPKIEMDTTELVEFPEKDESVGELMLSWIGVPHNDFLNDLALEVLGQYLTDSAVSPLYKEFVEIEEPACTDISFYSSTADPTILTVYLSSVPAEQLNTLPQKFKDALARIAKEGIDMTRMTTILERQKLQLLNSMETDAAEVLSDVVVADAVYGAADGKDLQTSLRVMSDYKALDTWSTKEWAAVLEKFYVQAPALTVVGKPSAALAEKVRDDAKAIVEANVKKYGPEGLAELAKKIEDAQAENDKPIPPEILRDFKIPDVDGIEWINVETARSSGIAKEVGGKENIVQKHVDADGAQLPLFVQFDHINSAFIQISVVLFPENVPGVSPAELRALLPIYLDSFFTLPVTRADGTKLDYEEVVKQLDAETLSYSIDINSPLQEGVTLKIKVSKDKYAKAISWLSDLLYGSTFSVERLKISAAKALQGIPSEKRDGSGVSYAAYRRLISDDVSTNVAMNLLNRAQFLPAFISRLKEEPEAVVSQFETFRQGLTNPRAIRVQVKGDILGLEKPSSTWLEQFKAIQPFPRSELVPVKLSKDVMGTLGKRPAKKIIIYGISSIESSFAYHVAKGPDSWTHEDQPALTVARAVLNAMEGFLWKFIRGAGLAYGASISQDLESGLIYYRVFKSPDSYAAFTAAQKLIEQLVSGEIEIDDLTIESAKSSLAYNTAAKEATISAAASASFTNMLLGLPPNYGRIALANTKDVSAKDIIRVIKKWIAPMFRPDTSIASIASGLAKMEEIATNFEKLGYEVERKTFDDVDESGSETGSETGSEFGLELSGAWSGGGSSEGQAPRTNRSEEAPHLPAVGAEELGAGLLSSASSTSEHLEAPQPTSAHSTLNISFATMLPEHVDIIVCGGGPAGSAVAGRLARADPNLQVLLVEAGANNHEDPSVFRPGIYNMQRIPENNKAKFYVDTMASSYLRGRKSIVPCANILGGGSSINFQMYTRASFSDWDDFKMEGWRGREDLLPLMKRLEDYQESCMNDTHGKGGPIAISNGGQITPLAHDYLRACHEIGIPFTDDLQDGDSANGCEIWKKYINRNTGRRSDAAHAYIHPLRKLQKNLHLQTNATVSRVLFEGTKAVGVAFVNPIDRGHSTPKEHVVRARKMVVLAGGTLGTPQILERSGVGSAELLKKLDIPVVSELPGVGEQYQDHYTTLQIFRASNETITTDDFLRGDKQAQDKIYNEYHINPAKALLASNCIDAGFKLRPTEEELKGMGKEFNEFFDRYFRDKPDKPVMFSSIVSGAYADHSLLPPGKYFTMFSYLEYPASRGKIHIQSKNPHAQPFFDSGFMNHPADFAPIRWGYQKSREVARRMDAYRGELTSHHPHFHPGSPAASRDIDLVTAKQLLPDGLTVGIHMGTWSRPSDPELVRQKVKEDIKYSEEDIKAIDDWVADHVETTWHSLGTCAMKPREKGGVVDAKLNVYGTSGLKIADLSIAPENLGTNTYSSALLCGEKCAQIIADELGLTIKEPHVPESARI